MRRSMLAVPLADGKHDPLVSGAIRGMSVYGAKGRGQVLAGRASQHHAARRNFMPKSRAKGSIASVVRTSWSNLRLISRKSRKSGSKSAHAKLHHPSGKRKCIRPDHRPALSGVPPRSNRAGSGLSRRLMSGSIPYEKAVVAARLVWHSRVAGIRGTECGMGNGP